METDKQRQSMGALLPLRNSSVLLGSAGVAGWRVVSTQQTGAANEVREGHCLSGMLPASAGASTSAHVVLSGWVIGITTSPPGFFLTPPPARTEIACKSCGKRLKCRPVHKQGQHRHDTTGIADNANGSDYDTHNLSTTFHQTRRDSPGRWVAPVVMITRWEFLETVSGISAGY
jgi:hypothetical protein